MLRPSVVASRSANVAWLEQVAPQAWRSRRGLQLALLDDDDAYVKAGVRTPETQAQLRALHGQHRQAFGYDRASRNDQPSTGDAVLDALVRQMETGHPHPRIGSTTCPASSRAACALTRWRCSSCVDDWPLHQVQSNPYTLTCKGWRGGQRYHDHEIHVAVYRVRPLIMDKLHKLRDPVVAQAVKDR
jgi:hypothetical protein